MKKNIKKVIIILFLILIIYLISKSLIKNYNINYTRNNYKITEDYSLNNKTHHYNITISNKSNTYIYSLEANFQKNKKIIKKIKTYKSNNLVCIVPIYKKDKDKNIYCNLDSNQVSNYYLLESENKYFQKILKKVKNYNVTINNSSKTKTYKKMTIYKNNLKENYSYIIWNYKGIYLLKNDEYKYIKILDEDLYDNIISTVVSNYFVLFDNTNVLGIDTIYYYDLVKDKLKSIKLDERISNDSYINGIIKDNIYITDTNNKKEYKLNIKKEKLEEIGNEEIGYITYSENKEKSMNKTEFLSDNQIFNNYLTEDNNYHYIQEDNKFYKALKSSTNKKILLFELNNINEWSIVDNEILLVSDDTLYLYNDDLGLIKIVESNELKYNYKNICKLWKKQ